MGLQASVASVGSHLADLASCIESAATSNTLSSSFSRSQAEPDATAGVMMQPQSMSLVMEYVPHGNLFKSIQQDSKGTLQWWDRGRHVALDIAKGLAYLHSRKVISLALP